jgi:hypothetical protein
MALSLNPDRCKIAVRLHAELNEARLKQIAASGRFNHLIASVPTGTPEPDASLEIQQTAALARAALHEYMKAMQRSADFMVHDIIPDFPEKETDPLPKFSSGKSKSGFRRYGWCPGCEPKRKD